MLNTLEVVDIYIDYIGLITGISPCPAGVVVSAHAVDSFIRPKIISTKLVI